MSPRCLALLLAAGMEASVRASEDGSPAQCADLAHSIAHSLQEGWTFQTLVVHLSSTAATRLELRRMNVTLGEVTFRQDSGVWTFDLRADDADMRRACQFIAIYANVLSETKPAEDGLPYVPSADLVADHGSWIALLQAVPEADRCRTLRALMVIAGVIAESHLASLR